MDLCEMNWPAIDAMPRDTPVVFPIAALEQHGRHMPLFTDSLLLGEVHPSRATSSRLRPRCCLRRCNGWATHIITWTCQGRCRHRLVSTWICFATWPRIFWCTIFADSFLSMGMAATRHLHNRRSLSCDRSTAVGRICLLLSLTYWDAADPGASIAALANTKWAMPVNGKRR